MDDDQLKEELLKRFVEQDDLENVAKMIQRGASLHVDMVGVFFIFNRLISKQFIAYAVESSLIRKNISLLSIAFAVNCWIIFF